MLERHWPWLVSIAAPAMAATLLVVLATLAPNVLKSTGYSFQSLTDSAAVEDDLLRMFYARDADHSRSLDPSEFVSATNEERRNEQLALFREVDLDSDGFVSANEYRTQLVKLRASSPPP